MSCLAEARSTTRQLRTNPPEPIWIQLLRRGASIRPVADFPLLLKWTLRLYQDGLQLCGLPVRDQVARENSSQDGLGK
jgi:hypothetical protein